MKRFNNTLNHIILEFSVIPPEAGLSDNVSFSLNVPKALLYFGNCINTVDIDHMWDATQMAGVLQDSKLIPTEKAISVIKDGERELPEELLTWLEQHPDEIYNPMYIVCGINEYQKIAFIYITELDIHFFFDAQF